MIFVKCTHVSMKVISTNRLSQLEKSIASEDSCRMNEKFVKKFFR